MSKIEKVSTGLPGLDSVIANLHIGDNVVWLVPSIREYRRFAAPYIKQALNDSRQVIYFRFASHIPIIDELTPGVQTIKMDSSKGFEAFTREVHHHITEIGYGGFYLFDSLSELVSEWVTDVSLTNFFMATCPYLYKLDTIAYFAIIKGYHSFQTIAKVRKTTQLLLEVYNDQGTVFVHPQKVYQRSTPTMFLPHKFVSEHQFSPVANSHEATNLFCSLQLGKESGNRYLDSWDKLFINAESVLDSGNKGGESAIFEKLCSALMGKDPGILSLVKKNFTLQDMLDIKSRMIGTGFIGGKSIGMLLARKIVANSHNPEWDRVMAKHDSFFIGSDIFYTYIIHNGWWELMMEQKSEAGYMAAGEKLEKLMLEGTFPEDIQNQFYQMLDYFGQYPFIIRSSSLLEDGYGNAFAGKYESFFCSKQGNRETRYEDFIYSLKKIYASAMSREALIYRRERELHQHDEVMSLLVQRVSGSYHEYHYYPHVAGVGLSYNTYVWNKDIDPHAGMLRLVMGLGTRAVNRIDGDYPRIVALNKPEMQPNSAIEDQRKFSQKDIDALDVRSAGKHPVSIYSLDKSNLPFNIQWIGTRNYEQERRLKETGRKHQELWTITFDRLLKSTFPDIMQGVLKLLEAEYSHPVDIEFTLNFIDDEQFLINLVQCRPLQIKSSFLQKSLNHIPNVDHKKALLRSHSNFMGGDVYEQIHRVIYIDPQKYALLDQQQKYDVARAIGKLNALQADTPNKNTFLIGPGRWGTSTPELGVPVGFAEINFMYAIAEMEYEAGGLFPELSFGTHFFQDMVETGIFYMAVFTSKKDTVFDINQLTPFRIHMHDLADFDTDVSQCIHVYDFSNYSIILHSNIQSQVVTLIDTEIESDLATDNSLVK